MAETGNPADVGVLRGVTGVTGGTAGDVIGGATAGAVVEADGKATAGDTWPSPAMGRTRWTTGLTTAPAADTSSERAGAEASVSMACHTIITVMTTGRSAAVQRRHRRP